jgi:hypothetical protein
MFIHTIDKVLSGAKTQTRRPVKFMDGYITVPDTLDLYRKVMTAKKKDFNDNGLIYQGFSSRVRFEVGKTYAVQSGRGQKGVARIEVLSIRQEDVREISRADVAAEGFANRHDFFKTWVSMHDPSASDGLANDTDFIQMTEVDFLNKRPAERYLAWALTFKLVVASK